MKKDVYKYLLKTYGNLTTVWIGLVVEIAKTIALKAFVPLLVVSVISSTLLGNFGKAKQNVLYLVIVYSVAVILGLLYELVVIKVTDARYMDLLVTFYRKIIGKDMAFYKEHQTGYLSGIFRQHLDGTINLLRIMRGDLVRVIVSLIAPVIVLLFIDWKIALYIFVIVIFQTVYTVWSADKLIKYRKSAQNIYRKLSGEMADDVTNIISFKLGGNKIDASNKVRQLAEEESKLFWVRHKVAALLELPRSLFVIVIMSFGFILIINNYGTSTQSVGLIILSFIFSLNIIQSASELPELLHKHNEHMSRVHPTLEYLTESYEAIKDPAFPVQLSNVKGAIKFENVNFSFPDRDVLKECTITIQPGEHLGIVGLSGSGKSTLLGLLMRFNDVTSGQITIDDVDVRSVTQDDLRKHIAYVPQEPLLFHRTIKENISYFNPSATESDISEAARISHAHDFIAHMESGYESSVGERGSKLSGGQKQRIAIAQAVLKHSPIFLFDEPTSALDSESEKLIQESLPEIIKGKTALIVAHRLSTVAGLDRIIVLQNGVVVEEGKHEELISKQGVYYSFWEKQNV